MQVEYRDNSDSGDGELILSDTVFPDEPWEISIQRLSDQSFASPGKQVKWVKEISFMPAKGNLQKDASLVIPVNTAIVKALSPKAAYRIGIRGKGNVIETGYLEMGEHAPDKTRKTPDGKPVTLQGKEAIAGPEEGQDTQGRRSSSNHGNSPERGESLSGQIAFPDSGKNAGASRKKARLVILGLLIVFAFLWYFFAMQKDESVKDSSVRVQEAPQSSQGLSVEEQVRRFFNGKNLTPLAAMELAAKLDKRTPDEQDAIYRLYYFAAENNEPMGLLEYGACMDPSLPQWGTISKDGAQAYTIYSKAIADKVPGAEKARDHLLEWLESEAGNGNSNAKSWLEQIGA